MTQHVYHNRFDELYYIHLQSQGGGRKPRYVMRKTRTGGLSALPEGYEIRENVHGQVYIRRRRKPVLLPQEDRLLRETMQRHHAAGYVLEIDGPTATIFASAVAQRYFNECLDDEFAEGFESALAEKLPGKFTPEMRAIFRERRQAKNGKRPKYCPLLRFVLADKKRRLFRTERVCFTGESGWLRLETLPLPAALMKYISHLGEDSFFDLL